MDVDEIQPEQRLTNRTTRTTAVSNGGAAAINHQLRGWQQQHSSRIIRVSRGSGGKDRHSKVWTTKGPRDRRVRLSVSTAIQFYDLQDRLGYDQPSKAVEWLIKAAADSIAELPALSASFPEDGGTLLGVGGGEKGKDGELEDEDHKFVINNNGQNQQLQGSSSASEETSKGSGSGTGTGGLSLYGSEIRGKGSERADKETRKREYRSKAKATKGDDVNVNQHHPLSRSSFTQLLTCGIGNAMSSSPQDDGGSELFGKPTRQWQAMDYFNTGMIGPSGANQSSDSSSVVSGLGNPAGMFGHDHRSHSELQHFGSFSSDHYVTTNEDAGNGNDYNLNVAISSSALAGVSRGTLQSNSLSLLPHHHERIASLDGSAVPFFLGAAIQSMDHHQHQHHDDLRFPAGLQLCYGGNVDVDQDSDHKEKGKT